MSAARLPADPALLAHEILADPRFAVPRPPPDVPSIWETIGTWLGHLLAPLLHGIGRALGVASHVNALVGYALIAAFVIALGWLAFLLTRAFAQRPRRAHAGSERVTAGDAPRSAAALHRAALDALRAGDLRRAAALLFAAAVTALDEAGRLAYDPARTPGDYRRLVQDPDFDAFARDAVIALYAAQSPSADLVTRMDERFRTLFGGAM